MTPDDFLSDAEIKVLTNAAKPARQAAKLATMGLPFEFTPTRVRVRQMLAPPSAVILTGAEVAQHFRRLREGGA